MFERPQGSYGPGLVTDKYHPLGSLIPFDSCVLSAKVERVCSVLPKFSGEDNPVVKGTKAAEPSPVAYVLSVGHRYLKWQSQAGPLLLFVKGKWKAQRLRLGWE